MLRSLYRSPSLLGDAVYRCYWNGCSMTKEVSANMTRLWM